MRGIEQAVFILRAGKAVGLRMGAASRRLREIILFFHIVPLSVCLHYIKRPPERKGILL